MDNTFINMFLLVFIIGIVVLYVNQYSNPINNNSINGLLLQNTNLNTYNNSGDNLSKCQNNMECYLDREANRKLGPVHNFHQSFSKDHYKLLKDSPQKKANVLGWRNHYITKNNKFLVSPDKNFDNVSTKNFLHNLENVKNVYRQGC
jgi:hypothetical protein